MIKSRLLFGCAFLAAGALALLRQDPKAGFSVLYALLLLSGLSLASVLAASRMIGIEERAELDTAFKHEEFRYFIKIRNRSIFFYPRVECVLFHAGLAEYGGDEAPIRALEPLRAAARIYRMRYPWRGVYELGVERLVITDFLGLFRCVVKPSAPLTVTVFPQKDESFLSAFRNEPQNSALHRDPFSEDYSSVADVRGYSSSDSLRKVHWKLSARRGELMVKNFNAFEPDKTVLCLDARLLPLEDWKRAAFEDRMVSCAAAILDDCARRRLPAGLLWGEADGDRAEFAAGDETVEEIYSLLAGIRFSCKETPLAAAEEISGPCNLVILTAGMDQAVHDAARRLISFDRNVILYSFYSRDLPLGEQGEFLLESLRARGADASVVPVKMEEEEEP